MDLSFHMSVISQSDCIPVCVCAHRPACSAPEKEEKKEREGKKKGLQPVAGLAPFFFSSIPWPFHSATSAETSFHSSCCSQLVKLHTQEKESEGDRGCVCVCVFRRGAEGGARAIWFIFFSPLHSFFTLVRS